MCKHRNRNINNLAANRAAQAARRGYLQYRLRRAVLKITLIARLRQLWAWLGHWLAFHKDDLGATTLYHRQSSHRAVAGHLLRRLRSRALFLHVVRVNGELVCEAGLESL